MYYLIKLISYLILLNILHVSGDTYYVNIGTEHHVNLVDDRFMSFTVDPKYLFSNNEKYGSKESICMASSLTPAFIRIAGPSTSLISFQNSTIAIDDPEPIESPRKTRLHDIFNDNFGRLDDVLKKSERKSSRLDIFERHKRHEKVAELQVAHQKWLRFVKWANTTGFDLVFAFNYDEKTTNGLWDPNMALNILTVAEKDKIGQIFWQLGHECNNQSIEEYLNDLETLRVIIETYPAGRSGEWKVVGGDVTKCLHQESKSDFKDYVTLSTDMMDAVLLNGNSSTYELERMSERNRKRLLYHLSKSATPLWLTEQPWSEVNELTRAADWLTSLGHAARNGFAVHYRELSEEELYQPTLSFYMALLYKNLVGSKVLNITMDPEFSSQAILFAHCTSLRHKAVDGAVTLYGVNMEEEPARFSVKMKRKEEGGDVLQFVIGHDSSGNVIVNGRPMYFEGDIKPVVKRVQPYKTLLINLPPKSFGFWVLANTNINACYEQKNQTDDDVRIDDLEEENSIKTKRSIDIDTDFDGDNNIQNELLRKKIINLNKNLNKIQNIYKSKRTKRSIDELNEKKTKLQSRMKHLEKLRESRPKTILSNILTIPKTNLTRNTGDRLRKLIEVNRNRLLLNRPRGFKRKSEVEERLRSKRSTEKRRNNENIEVPIKNEQGVEDISQENEIDFNSDENYKLWMILKKMHKQLKDLSEENHQRYDDDDNQRKNDNDQHHHRRNLKANSISEELSEMDHGFIKSTVENLLRVLADLNKNFNKFWHAINILDNNSD